MTLWDPCITYPYMTSFLIQFYSSYRNFGIGSYRAFPSWHYYVQGQQGKHQNNVWILLKTWRHYGAFIANFEQISNIVLVFPLVTLNKYIPAEFGQNFLIMAAVNLVIQNYFTSGICGRPNTSSNVRIPPTSMNSDKNLWLQRNKKMKPYLYAGVLKKHCPTYDNYQEHYHRKNSFSKVSGFCHGCFPGKFPKIT